MKTHARSVFLTVCCTFLLVFAASCERGYDGGHGDMPMRPAGGPGWFARIDPARLASSPGVTWIPNLRGYQQTTEYTCGPAALLGVTLFYGIPGFSSSVESEMRIAAEAGTGMGNDGKRPGTSPEMMVAWLEAHGFNARVDYEHKDDGSGLQALRRNLAQGIPTIVEWTDLFGHWVVAVGYDDRNNLDPNDDIVIFADSYDKYDDYVDGYTYVNAQKFYWLWWDTHAFETPVYRTMITATPR